MYKSVIFYVASLVAALGIAAGVWDGSNPGETAGIAGGGGVAAGAVMWSLYGKAVKTLKGRDYF